MSQAELERRGDASIITLVNRPQNRISKDSVRDLVPAWSNGGAASADRQLPERRRPSAGIAGFPRALSHAVTTFLSGTPRTALPMEGR